jgi:hypothetical protein
MISVALWVKVDGVEAKEITLTIILKTAVPLGPKLCSRRNDGGTSQLRLQMKTTTTRASLAAVQE